MTGSSTENPPNFELIYWPSIPGRGEFIRLALEATSTPYTDTANTSPNGINAILTLIDPKSTGDASGNPPIFAPPALRVPGAGKNGKPLLIHQTSCILAYLGPKIGMVPEDEADRFHVQQIALTALDLTNEAHDTHHPIATSKYYEDQKGESLKKAHDFRENRIAKYFGYFERVLKCNEGDAKGRYLIGRKLTYADTTVWQAIDGIYFAFPKELEARKDEFPLLLGTFYLSVKEESGIKEYLASERRKPYSQGIFRKYPELDRQ